MSLACDYGLLTNHLRVCATGSTGTVDYTLVNQTPVELATRKYIIKPSSPRWSEVRLANMEIFRISAGNTCPLKPGDILALDNSVTGTQPPITIYQKTPGNATLGFKSDRIGAIFNGNIAATGNALYTNIKFAFLPSTDYPGKPLNREFKDTMGVPSVEVVTFKKDLYTTTFDAEGLYLVQTDCTPNIIWTIRNVVEHGYVQVLTIERDR